MTKGEMAVFAAAFVEQIATVDGTNLKQKAEESAHAVQALAAVDAAALSPVAATMVRVMRGETT